MYAMNNRGRIITLITDFGLRDGTVGAMKGIILDICPEARVIDVAHDIPAHDVVAGALTVESVVPYFPKGTIHLAVVDPGVGSARQALALQTPLCCFVGPDNGIFELAWKAAEANFGLGNLKAIKLSNRDFFGKKISPTFHGRDIFAPVAAHLARGTTIEKLGTPATRLQRLGISEPTPLKGGGLQGTVLAFDHFGNAITNIGAEELRRLGPADSLSIHLSRRAVGPLRRTFADVEAGELVAYLGSTDRLEIAIRNQPLRDKLEMEPGETVTVRRH